MRKGCMKIQDIENMTAADLKAKRTELVKALGDAGSGVSVPELAARYVQARMDAKMRDEKLAEQGLTITNLNALLEVERAATKAALAKWEQTDMALGVRTVEKDQAWEEIGKLKETLAAHIDRGNRLKAEAERNFKALSTAEKGLKDALAARELDAAERG